MMDLGDLEDQINNLIQKEKKESAYKEEEFYISGIKI